MPIRDHLELVALLPYFKLTRKEQRALDDFNLVYDAALQDYKAQKLARWNQQFPRFVATDSILQHYERIVIEGDLFPENQRRRFAEAQPAITPSSDFLSDYAKLGDHHKIPLLPLTLPASLLALPAYRVVTLAFSPKGENFYYYYNQYLNKAIKIHAKQQDLHNHSSAYFHEFLNELDSDDFYRRVQCDPDDLPILYRQLSAALAKQRLKPSDLACTDGKPLEFIGSMYLHGAFKAALIAEDLDPSIVQNPEQLILTRARYQELLDLSAQQGCHNAAIDITNRVAARIRNSSSILEAQQSYNEYQTQYGQIFLDNFKAAGALLVVNLQLEVLKIIRKSTLAGGCREISVLDENANTPDFIDRGTICIQMTQKEPGEIKTYWSKNDGIIANSYNKCRFSPDFIALLTMPSQSSNNRELCQELVLISDYALPHLGFEHFNTDLYQVLLNLYTSLQMANQLARFYKNTLRTFFATDRCDHYIQTLFAHENKGKKRIKTLIDAIGYIKNLCPRFSNGELKHPRFAVIDRHLVTLNRHQPTVWPEDYALTTQSESASFTIR